MNIIGQQDELGGDRRRGRVSLIKNIMNTMTGRN